MRRWIFVLALMIAGTMSMPAFGSELDELKATVLQLQKRIEQLENQQKMQVTKPPAKAEAAEPAKPVMAGSMPGSIMIPGTDTSLKIYGNVRVDATYDFAGRSNDINNNDWSAAVFAQPLDTNSANQQRKNQLYATARASRLGIVTSTPSQWGDLEVKVEGDFNAPNAYMGELGSNGTQFRLRHAYGRWGNLLVGQTWSNFIDLRSYPETVDFNPTGDVTLIRQAQLRYTLPLGGSSLAFSIENPEGLSGLPPYQNRSNTGRIDFDRVHDFVVNWTLNGEKAHVSARAVTMEYNNDNHSQRGYALALSGSSRLGAGTLVASIQGGDGIGRYMFNSVMQGATDTGTDLRLWRAMGWHIGYTLPWSSALRSNFIASQTYFGTDEISNAYGRFWSGKADEFVPNKRVDQASVNLLWGVMKNVEAGIEYSWGRRITFADEEGTQHRINTMIQYNFF
ncbi:MAG: DcaP family trimeric outer membrane transporter [Deltaproteobacteria bacterium]|nr:DcaP family trimeric outer membrane transporter [Deltaproteobacteria bacterium]